MFNKRSFKNWTRGGLTIEANQAAACVTELQEGLAKEEEFH